MPINESRRIHDDLNAIESGREGSVILGIAPMFATYILDAAVAKLHDEAPRITLEVMEGMHADLLTMLQNGEVDLVFMNFTHDVPQRGLASEELCSVTATIAASATNPLTRKKRLLLQNVKDAKWVAVSHLHVSTVFVEFTLSNGLSPPDNVVMTNSLSLVRSLILNHGFLSMLPEQFLDKEIASGAIKSLRVSSGPLRRPAGLIYRTGSPHRPATETVAQVIRQCCEQI